MSAHSTLLERNQQIAETFEHADMPAFPKMNTMVLVEREALALGSGCGKNQPKD